ncbi:MAG: C45 family peptidase [Vicingaceae bacterium]
MFIIARSLEEATPGEKWKTRFKKNWPFYRKWFLSEGVKERPGYLSCVENLGIYMPELLPVYDQLCELVGGGDLESRYLSQWCPPPYMSGCSQLAWVKDGPCLIRNYDYGIEFFEGLIFKSNWLKPVIGVSDSSWGLLDGINGDGLVASLTFGGRKVVGNGMGIPLIIRYILETCADVHQAIAVLKRVPVHMAYNVTLIDRNSEFFTVYLSPDHAPDITNWAVGTNHQHTIEWPDYARISKTVERKSFLDECWLDPHQTRQGLVQKFLTPPVFNTNYKKRFGTLYTGMYDCIEGSLHLYWHGLDFKQSFEEFKERRDMIMIGSAVSQKIIS